MENQPIFCAASDICYTLLMTTFLQLPDFVLYYLLCIFDICTRWVFLTRCRIEIKGVLHLFTIGKISWCLIKTSMREKCPYSEFFWSVFSLTTGKYGPEKLRIWTLITQCVSFVAEMRNYSCQWCYWDFLNKTFTNGWTWEKVSFDLLDLFFGFWKDLSFRLLLLLCEMIFMSRFLVFSRNKIVLY